MKRFQGFIGAAYQAQSPNVDAERCVNLYPELTPPGFGKDREVMSLRSTPATVLFGTTGSGVGRGCHEATGRAFFVTGPTLYEMSSAGVPTSRGTLNTFVGTVHMADNGLQLVIVDGVYGYTLTLATNVFAQISDVDFPANPTSVDFVDQYIIVTTDDGQFNISALLDATDWDGLDFATAEGAPDDLVGHIIDHRDAFLLGTQSTEVWENNGDADFPFIRRQLIEMGCGNIDTAKKFDNSVVFGGVDKAGTCGVVRIADAVNYLIISTPPINKLIEDNGGFSASTAWTYTKDKHEFYRLNLNNVSRTFAYDAQTQLWHECSYTPVDGSGETRHRADNHIYCFGKHLVNDYQNGNVYELVDSGIDSNDELEAILRWSNDAGHTWHEATAKSMGARGRYKTRVKWERLGMARTRTYEVVITDTVYTDNDAPITRRRRAPHLSKNGARLRHVSFELDAETGAAQVTLLGANLNVVEARS